jgi:hypothetical protein
VEELLFVVEQRPNGGFTARALSHPISAEAGDLETLHTRIKEAIRRHFAEGDRPRTARLYLALGKAMEL